MVAMFSMWTHSPYALLLLMTVLGCEAKSSHIGKRHEDVKHRVEKVQIQITALPAFARKREVTTCASNYTLCPASLKGGCCPGNYECATDACYATTAGTSSACGKSGYYFCPASVGGCCPQGYICGADCYPPAGASSYSMSCPANYHSCAASFNGGCCMKGYECGPAACYVTTPSTTTYTKIVTTTGTGGQTVTSTTTATTIQTPTAPTAPTALATGSGVIAKFIPSKVDKIPATSSPDPNGGAGGGLTKAQLGGIVGGAISVLLIVMLAAFIIIRRLNHAANITTTAKAPSSGNASQPEHPPMTQYASGNTSSTSYDPLLISSTDQRSMNTPQEVAGSLRHRSDSDFSQPGMTPVNTSGVPSTDGIRHPGLDSGYFDIPARVSNVPGRPSMRTSADSQGNVTQYSYPQYHQHGRQWSSASDQSATSSDGMLPAGSPLIPAELDTGGGFIPELPTSLNDYHQLSSNTVAGSRPNAVHHRRHSSKSVMNSPTLGVTQPLDVVNENAEVMHGYYGPRRGQVGQTAAGLNTDARSGL